MGVKLAEWFQCSEFCQNEGRSRSWFAGCKSRPPDGRQRGLSSVASTNPASLPRPPTREFHSMFNTSNIYVFTIPATAVGWPLSAGKRRTDIVTKRCESWFQFAAAGGKTN